MLHDKRMGKAYSDDVGDGGSDGLRGIERTSNLDGSDSSNANIDGRSDVDDDRAEVDRVNGLGLDERICGRRKRVV